MAAAKKIFSETTGPMKLKLGIDVPSYKDSQVCSRHSDWISNMAAMTYFSKILLIAI